MSRELVLATGNAGKVRELDRLLGSIQAGQSELAQSQAEVLRNEYQSTPYAVLAAFAQARLHLEKGETDAALAALQWAMGNTQQESLQHVARLRLARVLLQEGKPEEAQRQLQVAATGSFAAEYAELEGDIALARGDEAAARSAYEKALAGSVANETLVRMKLADLASPSGPTAVTP